MAEGPPHYLLAVNYHYLGETKFPYPGIHPLSPRRFKEQIEILGRSFEFISQLDLLNALDGNQSLPKKACLLTFDDGLREQYEHAVPILDALGVPAVFFIPGKPYAEAKPLTVHKFHWLRSCTPASAILQAVEEACYGLGFRDRFEAVRQADIAGKYFWDDVVTRKVKYLFNVELDAIEQERLIDHLLDKQSDEGQAYFENLYLTREQIRELASRFAVGTHCYSHTALAPMTEVAIEQDIRRSIAVLSDMVGIPAGISYPFGYEEAVSPTVISVAERCGLRFGFTRERSFNRTLGCPLALACVDTNDAPGGKKPIIHPNGDGFDIHAPMTIGRRRYIPEKLSS